VLGGGVRGLALGLMREGCPVLDVLEIVLDHPAKVVYEVVFAGDCFPLTTLKYYSPRCMSDVSDQRLWAHQAGPLSDSWKCNQMLGCARIAWPQYAVIMCVF
jgi:hypothetical protein